MRQRNRLLALLLCAAVALGGCASNNGNKQGTARKEVEEAPYQAKLDVIEPAAYGNAQGLALEKGAYISIIGKAGKGFFWEQVQAGVEQAEKDINAQLGYEGKDKVKVTYSAPAEADSVDEQVNILDEELARYPVAVGISVADEQACGVQFDLAADSGIPVVTFDSGSDYQGILAAVSTDNPGSAAVVAEKMGESLKGAGEVVIFAHDSRSKAGKQRIESFQAKLKASYPGVAVAGVCGADNLDEWQKQIASEIDAGTYSADGIEPAAGGSDNGNESDGETGTDPESITQEQVVDYIFAKYPNLKGIYGTDAEAMDMIADGIERAQKKGAVVMGYDANDGQLERLEDGTVEGLIVQNPFGMGYAAVIAAARASLEMGNEAYVNTGYVWVTKDNMDDAQVEKFLSE